MSKWNMDVFLEQAKITERKFVSLFDTDDVVVPTKAQDMKEHWDIQIDGIKYDVKGVKNECRTHGSSSLYHWVERTNVNGFMGWLYGNADRFAFETADSFIIVDKDVLQKFIHENAPFSEEELSDSVKSPYKWYTRMRWGRYDEITPVPIPDLINISRDIIKKRIDE